MSANDPKRTSGLRPSTRTLLGDVAASLVASFLLLRTQQESQEAELPTDLAAVLARKRYAKAQRQKENQSDITMISLCVIICLAMLALAFVDTSYAQAMAELIDLF
jgi:hypothetical protein